MRENLTVTRFLKIFFEDYTKLDRNATLNPLISLGFGAVAGMLGQCSSYPLDIVRRRMQTDTQGQYKSIRATVKIIYKFVQVYAFRAIINFVLL